MNIEYLTDIIMLLAAAVIAVPLFQYLGLGAIPGFLVAGMVLGPSGLGAIENYDEIAHLAELGVVLLLFVIGIEINPSRLWRMKRLVLGLGTLQVLVTGGLITVIIHQFLDLSWKVSLLTGMALALSSTAFVLQLLAEKKLLYSDYGRPAVAVLLLQDLAPAQTGDWVDGVSLEQAELALRAIARQHAAWWAVDPTTEPELADLMNNLETEQDLVERLYAEAWPRFLQDVSRDVPDDVRDFGHRLVGRLATAEATLDDSPHTLMHGDFRLGNILFGARDGESSCWVIDWEDIMLWSGMFDVAWFLGSCLRIADGKNEQGLVRSYHRQLTQAGVTDYAWTQCYHDYRCAMINAFVQGILTAVPSASADAYARQLARAVGERFMLACQRLRLNELMPG